MNEIQRWTFSGSYVAGTAEIQNVFLDGCTSGDYTLSISGFGTTGSCVSDPGSWSTPGALALDLQNALNAILPWPCSVSDDLSGRLIVTFSAKIGDVPSMTVASDTTNGVITPEDVTTGVETSKTTWSWDGDDVTYYYYLDDPQAIAELLYGSGNVLVTNAGAATYDFEFIGALANTNVPMTTATADNYAGTSAFTLLQEGSSGITTDETGSGGVVASGTATIGLITSKTGIGGVVASGSALNLTTLNLVMSGGINARGSAIFSVKYAAKQVPFVCTQLGKTNAIKYWELKYPEYSKFYQKSLEPAYLPAITRCIQDL